MIQPLLLTQRMILEPILENHAEDLYDLFSDRELHTYVPFEPLTLEEHRARCARWAKRKSPDEKEIWLNWLARLKADERAVGHFQVGIKDDLTASIGYMISRSYQKKGFAAEALEGIFDYLRNEMMVKEIKAWSDTRNLASHRLAEKMGMVKIETIKNADFFKGESSDEFVFSIKF